MANFSGASIEVIPNATDDDRELARLLLLRHGALDIIEMLGL